MAINRDKPTATKPATTETKAVANPPVSFDMNDPVFQQIVAQAVAVRLAAIEAEKPAKMSIAGKSEQSIKNDLAAVRAFRKAGFGTLVPHVDIMTFNRWAEAGFRPKEGTKAVKVQNLRLFCKAQCRPITPADKKAMAEQKQAHEGRKGNAAKGPKVVPINSGAPQ